ncbi:MAG: DNA polymerase III subunit gamma/tau [Oscillospiraceae bacterium]|nr:DNA polymerase III subunit gamma/tau [Oscillospiraceae bacterium]
MYQALYRKWRPQTFDQVVGQSHITETLKSQVRSGRLSHAYIFIGTRGTGKTTCARILARAVNCEHPVDGNPCGHCAACRGILDGSVLDVVELDAASNNGVDNVRALREEAVFSPATVKKRVYIIDEVHMLSTPAFNALLKILEEPPEHLMFILATTELQKVPATILSRCQRHSFRRIEAGEISKYLRYIASQEHFTLRDEAADLIARMADGGVRDALSLLDQCSASETIDVDAVYSALGLAGNRRVAELLDKILRHDTAAVLQLFSAMWMDGKDPSTLLTELSGLMRDVLMVHVAPKSAGELISGAYDAAALSDFAKRMTTEELLCAMDTVQRALSGLRTAGNPKTAAELCLVSLCDDTAGESLQQLRARVSRLEEELARGVPVRPAYPQSYAEEAYEDEPELRCEVDDEDDEEDELDPAMFVEEQPEDIIVKREAPSAVEAERAEAPVLGSWKEICEAAKAVLPMDLRVSLNDETKVRGALEDGVLVIEALPGFLYDRFNRQDVLGKFAEAARGVCGRELRVQLRVLRERETNKRSLDELKQFKEVQFL